MAIRSVRLFALVAVAMLVALASPAPAVRAAPTLPALGDFDMIPGTWQVIGPKPVISEMGDLYRGCHGLTDGSLLGITISASGALSGGCNVQLPSEDYYYDVTIVDSITGTVNPATGVATLSYSISETAVEPETETTHTWNVTFNGSTNPAQSTDAEGRGKANFTVQRTCVENVDPTGCSVFDTYSYVGTVDFRLLFLPAATNDTQIHHIEVVQVVQTQDNAAPLVAGKSTLVRVFATSTFARFDVTVTLRGKRGQQPLEEPIRVNGSASSAFPDFDAEKSFNSFNFRLPDSWLTPGTVLLEAEVTFTNGPSDLPDLNLANNKKTLSATFEARKRLSVGYIPVCVKNAEEGCPHPGIAATPAIINRLFPISNEGIIYQRVAGSGLEIDALPSTRSQMQDILLRLARRNALMALSAPETMPDQLAAWIQPNTAPAIGRAFTLDSGGDGRSSLNVYNPADPADSQATLAHEIAHNLGRKHPNQEDSCDAKDSTTDWPFTTSTIQDIGWDFRTNNTVLPTKFDIMSYCGGFGASQLWISPFTFTHLFDANGVPQNIAPAAGEVKTYLVVSGAALANGFGGGLDPATILASAANVPAMPATGTHCIRFNTQATGHCFVLDFFDHEDNLPLQVQEFVVTVPVPPGGFDSYRLCKSPCGVNDTIVEVTKTANAPMIEITSPLPGSSFSDQATLTWTASDADNDVLRYTVLHSSDGGSNWIPLLADAAVTSYTFDAGMLAGGPGGKFRVLASDGAWTTTAEVGNITVGTMRPWGDLQCNGGLDLGDVLAARRGVAGVSKGTAIGCPMAGGLATISGIDEPVTWGDLRCNGDVDAVEVLDLLRTLAGLPVIAGAGECPSIGELVFATG